VVDQQGRQYVQFNNKNLQLVHHDHFGSDCAAFSRMHYLSLWHGNLHCSLCSYLLSGTLKQLFSQVIFWNGALGITEHPFYKNGSEQLVHLLGQCPGDVVIGGGDTAGFVQNFTDKYDFFHISTGGGASIDDLTSETLPGIAYYEAQGRPRGASVVEEYRALALKGKATRKTSLDDIESPPVRACDLEPPPPPLSEQQNGGGPPLKPPLHGVTSLPPSIQEA
jgi:hypothetical protein